MLFLIAGNGFISGLENICKADESFMARPWGRLEYEIFNKGNFIVAISDYNKAIEINPNLVEVYHKRAIAYFLKQEYDKSWQDVDKAELLGYEVWPEFLEKSKILSEREK